jgi:hypothetical protein
MGRPRLCSQYTASNTISSRPDKTVFESSRYKKGTNRKKCSCIVRLKAIDYDSPTHERKEYLYYDEYWEGKNFLGISVTNPVIGEHIQGRYMEVVTRPKLDERTGEHIENVFAGTRERYYIPFSKKNVDEKIANSVHSTSTIFVL